MDGGHLLESARRNTDQIRDRRLFEKVIMAQKNHKDITG